MNINTLQVNHSGSIFLGGYLLDDSLRRKYSMVVLNDNGKRLWSRTYTGNGMVVKVAECPDQKILVAGTNWRAKIDPKGYLVWESSFGEFRQHYLCPGAGPWRNWLPWIQESGQTCFYQNQF